MDIVHLFTAEGQGIVELRQQDRTLWQKICDWFKDLEKEIRSVIDAYRGVGPDSKEGKMVAQMEDALVILESLYADALVDASENFAGAEKNTAEGGGMKHSIKNTSTMTLEQQLKLYYTGKLKSSDSLYFGTTPATILESGLDELPLAFLTSDFKKSTQEKHNVPRRAIKALRTNLSNALFSFGIESKIGFVVPDIDGDGKPLLIGIEKDVKMDNRLVNAIRSSYGLDNPKEWLGNQISTGKKFVVYDEKGANSFLRPYGYSASREDGIKLLDKNVPQKGVEVKKKSSFRDTRYVSSRYWQDYFRYPNDQHRQP